MEKLTNWIRGVPTPGSTDDDVTATNATSTGNTGNAVNATDTSLVTRVAPNTTPPQPRVTIAHGGPLQRLTQGPTGLRPPLPDVPRTRDDGPLQRPAQRPTGPRRSLPDPPRAERPEPMPLPVIQRPPQPQYRSIGTQFPDPPPRDHRLLDQHNGTLTGHVVTRIAEFLLHTHPRLPFGMTRRLGDLTLASLSKVNHTMQAWTRPYLESARLRRQGENVQPAGVDGLDNVRNLIGAPGIRGSIMDINDANARVAALIGLVDGLDRSVNVGGVNAPVFTPDQAAHGVQLILNAMSGDANRVNWMTNRERENFFSAVLQTLRSMPSVMMALLGDRHPPSPNSIRSMPADFQRQVLGAVLNSMFFHIRQQTPQWLPVAARLRDAINDLPDLPPGQVDHLKAGARTIP